MYLRNNFYFIYIGGYRYSRLEKRKPNTSAIPGPAS